MQRWQESGVILGLVEAEHLTKQNEGSRAQKLHESCLPVLDFLKSNACPTNGGAALASFE